MTSIYLTRSETSKMQYKIDYLVEDPIGTSWLIQGIEVVHGEKLVHLVGDGNMGKQILYDVMVLEEYKILMDMYGII